MTSRLDRLFTLLENCPNVSLRNAAAEQLGELVQRSPENAEHILDRLVPLLRSRSWACRVAAADAVSSFVHHLPTWIPTPAPEFIDKIDISDSGFLTLERLNIKRVLSQGARLYSMDFVDLEHVAQPLKSSNHTQDGAFGCTNVQDSRISVPLSETSDHADDGRITELSCMTVTRSVLNSRLGLEDEGIVSKVLSDHSNVSSRDWILPEDLAENTDVKLPSFLHKDVAACVHSTFEVPAETSVKRSPSNCSPGPDAKFPRLDEDVKDNLLRERWPLDKFCTTLLGDLWNKRWETRHGAATGLRELLSESRHTKHCGKCSGMSEKQMHLSHSRYLEDITVRVLCTLALDQLSDFITDEVVAPVRETAAQLLGVLSLHLTADQVSSVAKHLVHLVTLDCGPREPDHKQPRGGHGVWKPNTWENTWMIIHGGLLGIRYLLVSRKDISDVLLPIVSPSVLYQLTEATYSPDSLHSGLTSSAAAEDIRSAAASALLPIVDERWLRSLGCSKASLLIDRIWCMLRETASDCPASTGPLLQLVSAMTKSVCVVMNASRTEDATSTDAWSTTLNPGQLSAAINTILRIVHHSSSSIRQQSLDTLQCLFNISSTQGIVLSSPDLQLVIDQLYHRILLESIPSIRKRATDTSIYIIQSTAIPNLAASCTDRLDFWLCQAMQPIGVPFPHHLFTLLGDEHGESEIQATTEPPTPRGNLFYIGGDQNVSEYQVWPIRISAIRILANLFARLGQFYAGNAAPSDGQPSILGYFLDHLLCRLHLTERLAMQRTIGCLLLTCWALLPGVSSPEARSLPWSDVLLHADSASLALHPSLSAELPSLCAKLRAKLESCLTQVIYYEEILGVFKLMQEDCRQAIVAVSSLGLVDDSTVPSTGVRTIAQCSSLLDQLSQAISRADGMQTSGGKDQLLNVLDKARLTVDRCMALQLLWGSRVEFSVATSFVSLGWLLPGRLSLLIRPLMDTIRGRPPSAATTTIGDRSVTQFPPVSLVPLECVAELQRLACFSLARLLLLEWLASGSPVNESRAAAKVVKNLVASLLDEDASKTNGECTPETPASSDAAVSLAWNSNVNSVPGQPNTDNAHPIASRSGPRLALALLSQTFLRKGLQSAILRNLRVGLPSLWHVIWVGLVDDLWSILRDVPGTVGDSFESWRRVIGSDHLTSPIATSSCLAKQTSICTSLSALLACLPTVLPFVDTDTSDRFTFDGLLSVGIVGCCLPSQRIREHAVRLLSSLVIQRAVPSYNIVVPEFLAVLSDMHLKTTRNHDHSPGQSVLAALTGIVNTLTSDMLSTDLYLDISTEPFHECLAELQLLDSDNTGSKHHLPSPLRSFLPYVAILVPPVLRLLPNQDTHLRTGANRLFTALLNLFPFERSVPSPPDMDPRLSQQRSDCQLFIDSLLHPDRIEMYNLPVPINAKLRAYQQNGVNWLNFLNRFGLNGILCDDLGLGKTLQTVCILAGSHHEQAGCKPKSLIVCPSTLCAHWLSEVRQFDGSRLLDPVIYAGTPSTRLGLQSELHRYTLIITSYDMIRNDINYFQDLMWHYVVLDEGHIIKNSKSKVTQAVKRLRSQHRLILTGTPIQNQASDLWSLFDYLMPGFLGSESVFTAKFVKPVALSRDPKASKSDQRAGRSALENLHRLVLPFMLRRLKEDVLHDLPPKTIQDYPCEMSVVQCMLYEAFTRSAEGQQLTTLLHANQAPGLVLSVDKAPRGFQALRYLQAICNHPSLALKRNHPLLDDVKRVIRVEYGPDTSLDSIHLSGKLCGLCRLLTDCGFGTPRFDKSTSSVHLPAESEFDAERSLMSQHRALLFFQTRDMLQLTETALRRHFPWITSTRLDGTVPASERHDRVVRFNEDPSIDLMLLTTAVGGLGLNLTGADTVIFVEHDWNPTKDLQAMDRAHRIGQRRAVTVYRLITQDSIEQQIMNIQAFKLHLANTVITADNRDMSSMDTGHLFDRFSAPKDSSNGGAGATPEDDDFEGHYDKEYNMEAFVAKLSTNKS